MGAIPSTIPPSTYPMPSNSYPGSSNNSTMWTINHTTLPRMWDAYAGFNVIARDSNKMRCIGSNTSKYKLGNPCGWWWSEWKLPEDDHPEKYQQLRSLFDNLETKHPREAEAKLEEIASLSLCHYHQNQAYKFTEPWKVMLLNAAQEYAGEPSQSQRDEWLNMEERKVKLEQIRSELAAVKSEHEDALLVIQKLQANDTEHEALAGKLKQRLAAKEAELKSRGDQMEKLIEHSNNLRSQLQEEKRVSQRLGSELENAKQSNAVLSDEVKRHAAKMVTKIHSSAALKEEVAQLGTYNTTLEDQRKALEEDRIEREEIARVSKSSRSESERDGVLPTEQNATTAEQHLSIIEKSLQESQLDHAGSQSKLEEAMKAVAKKQEEISVQIIALKQSYEVDLARLKTENTALAVQNNKLQARLDSEKEDLTKLRVEMSISKYNLQDVKQDAITAAGNSLATEESLKESPLEITDTCNKLEGATKGMLGKFQSFKAAFKWMRMATWKRRMMVTTQQNEGSP